jgi:hypothetical protein
MGDIQDARTAEWGEVSQDIPKPQGIATRRNMSPIIYDH